MDNQRMIINQLDQKIKKYTAIGTSVPPGNGWIFSIRKGLNMSLRQLGKMMGISAQGVYNIEKNEQKGTITLHTLEKVSDALNMKFVYGFIPKEKTLEAMIEKRAKELAKEIVLRSSVTMDLENQTISKARINRAIKEKTEELTRTVPKYLWK